MNNFETEIIKSKKILRSKSKNYKKNFEKISDFIKSEVNEIKKFQEKNLPIIPEVNFNDISNNKEGVV